MGFSAIRRSFSFKQKILRSKMEIIWSKLSVLNAVANQVKCRKIRPYLPTAYVVRGKVMFWHVSVHPSICLSTPRGGVPEPGPGGYPRLVQVGGTRARSRQGGLPQQGVPQWGVPQWGGGYPNRGYPDGECPDRGCPPPVRPREGYPTE